MSEQKGVSGLRRIVRAFGYSLQGIRACYRHEAAFLGPVGSRQPVLGAQPVAVRGRVLPAHADHRMVDTVIASSIGVLSFQWHTKLNTITKPGGGIVVGAYVIRQDKLEWRRVSVMWGNNNFNRVLLGPGPAADFAAQA